MRELDLHWHVRPLLDRILGNVARVARGATGNDDDAVDGLEVVGAEARNLVEPDAAVRAKATHQGVGDRLRLVGNLFGHERRPTALGCRRSVPIDGELGCLNRLAIEGAQLDLVGAQNHDLVLTNRDGALGVLNKGGNVGAQEVFAIAQANHERCVAAGGEHDIRFILVNDENRKGAVQSLDHVGKGVGQVAHASVFGGNQVGGNLGVGLAGKDGAGSHEFGLEFGEVFDDAVVNQR